MASLAGGIGDSGTAEAYAQLCRSVADRAGATERKVDMLERLGHVVADCRLAATPGVEIDPSGALAGLDDDELADWWLNDCDARSIVLSAAATGATEALDWTIQMLQFADAGATAEFGHAVRSDLGDMIERVVSAQSAHGERHDHMPLAASPAPPRMGWGAYTRPAAALEHANRRRA